MTNDETNTAGDSSANNGGDSEKRISQLEKQNKTLSSELTKYRKKSNETDKRINEILEQSKNAVQALEDSKKRIESLESDLSVARNVAQVSQSGDRNMQNELAVQLAVAQAEIESLKKAETDPEKITAQRQEFAKRQAERVDAIFAHTRARVNNGKYEYLVKVPNFQPMPMKSDYPTVDEFRNLELVKRFGDNNGNLIVVEPVA